MNDQEHHDLQELLGAFALDATDALEARRIERHISTCDGCMNEVRQLREAASELAWLPEHEDTGDLVDRITQTLPSRPRRVTTRLSAGIAAISVAAAAVLGVVLIQERNENGEIGSILASATREVRLGAQGGFKGQGSLHIVSDKAVLTLKNLPAAGRDRAYQLWAIEGSTPRSLSVIGGDGQIVQLMSFSGTADSFAITVEPSGGSPKPTTDPVLVGA